MTTTTTATAIEGREATLTVLISLVISCLAYLVTSTLVPFLSHDLVAKGLRGRDMLKRGFTSAKHDDRDDDDSLPGRKWIPEATGVIGASVYILLLSLFAPLPFLPSLLSPSPSTTTTTLQQQGGGGGPELQFPHHSFATYLASLLSLLIATFLGFCDDVFDIRWRFKLPIPLIASVPLLVTYAAGHGVTDVVIPNLFGMRQLLNVESTNGVLHLGWMYYLYMSMLSTFCTNSINILAGINGVEVSQALIISISLILNDLLYLSFRPSILLSFLPTSTTTTLNNNKDSAAFVPLLGGVIDSIERLGTVSFGMSHGSTELQDRHLFSIYFMLPLVGVCLGLLKHNWYPSRAFVGDTFCYFSGMSFAVTAILSHYSKTLLLFFLPQIFNFVYSCPQLFGFVPCPRHRLPKLNHESGLLETSWTVIKPRNLRNSRERVGVVGLRVLEKFGLVKLRRRTTTTTKTTTEGQGQGRGGGGEIEASTNLTVLNLVLIWKGETREDELCKFMCLVQVGGSLIAFGIRYGLGSWIYGGSAGDRR